MSNISDNKILDTDFSGKDIESISEDTVVGRAEWLKARFDSAAKEVITPKVNGLIDALLSEEAAGQIGAAPFTEGSEATLRVFHFGDPHLIGMHCLARGGIPEFIERGDNSAARYINLKLMCGRFPVCRDSADLIEKCLAVGSLVPGGADSVHACPCHEIGAVGIHILAQFLRHEDVDSHLAGDAVAVRSPPACAGKFVYGKHIIIVGGVIRHAEILRL